MLEWALPEGGDSDSIEAAKTCNPASWLTEEALTEQREAVHDLALRRSTATLDRRRGAVDHWPTSGTRTPASRSSTVPASG